jgi:hypothetical protein
MEICERKLSLNIPDWLSLEIVELSPCSFFSYHIKPLNRMRSEVISLFIASKLAHNEAPAAGSEIFLGAFK